MIDGNLGQTFQDHLPRGHWQRIESSTGGGIPDLNFCLGGVEGWIENKRALDTWRPGIRPEQVGWIERRLRNGGRVFVAVRRITTAGPRKGKASDSLYLYRGEAIRPLLDGGMNHEGAARYLILHCSGLPARWDWLAISKVLTDPFPRNFILP